MEYVYVCYQAGDRSIMSICDNEKLAQEICSEHDDAYVKFEINKDYGREPLSTDDIAIYNINGVYKTNDR